MVYESDFYTTRRPYSSRPYVSSYSVTVRQIPHLPYCAHRKLVSIVHTPVRIYHAGQYLPIKIHSRVRPSVIAAELNRIRYLTRPSYQSYTEKYLNSKDYIDFDDETRQIRAKTDNLLRRIHVFVPRPAISEYDETSPERLRSDDYVRRIINAKHARKDIEDLPWYSTPEKRDIGAGHLACVKFAGGRPQSRRRPYYTVGDLVPGDVKSDVNLMSFYMKNRKAAEDAYPQSVHHREHPSEPHYAAAPSPTVTWADEVVHEEVETAEEPMVTEQEIAAEVEAKPEVETKLIEQKPSEAEEIQKDEDDVKKTPDDDTIKKIQEYLEKKAADKKLEEERRAWEVAERRRLEAEKEIARLAAIKQEEDRRLAEIKEQERLEAERQAVLQRAEDARQEAERLVEDEKLFGVAVAQAIQDEQERVLEELTQEKEEIKKQEEEEEVERELVTSVAPDVIDDEITIADPPSEENSQHAELSDQENEEKPFEVDHDDETQIEEDEHEEPDEIENPFVTDEAAANPETDEPVPDTPKIRESGGAGGEQGFDWSEIENETDVEESHNDMQTPPAEDVSVAVDQPQVFEESDVESQAEAEEALVEETHVLEDTHEDEAELTAEVQEESQVFTEAQEKEEEMEDVEETKEEQEEIEETKEAEVEDEDDGEVTITEIQDEEEVKEISQTLQEEIKFEERLVHSASEEEDEEEED